MYWSYIKILLRFEYLNLIDAIHYYVCVQSGMFQTIGNMVNMRRKFSSLKTENLYQGFN